MKTFYSLLFFIFISAQAWCQIVEIPDPNFVNWLTLNFPECMDGNMMNTQCQSVLGTTNVVCSNEDISDLEGLQYFTGMEQLQAQQNNLTSFPPLPVPNSITSIDVRYNDILSISYIPESVFVLKLSGNENLSSISYFPVDLDYLYIDDCISLLEIPDLPAPNMNTFSRDRTPQLPLQELPLTLSYYAISACGLAEIPEVPPYLFSLNISNNDLGNQSSFLDISEYLNYLNISNTNMSALPALPDGLVTMKANENQLTELPVLPASLENLQVYSNPLTSLELTTNIVVLWASGCDIETITPNYLPNCVELLVSSNNLTENIQTANEMVFYDIATNSISCLTWLPETADFITISENPITCVPSLPVYVSSDIDIESLPVCQSNDPVNNPNGCFANTGFEGYVYLDQDEACDFDENTLSNIPIKIGLDGVQLGITNSFSNGRYSHLNDFGDYEVGLDQVNVPFVNNCLSHEFTLDETNPFFTDLNFALSCEYENDFGIQSVIPSGWAFPGQSHVVKIFAGELSQFYNANCSGPSSGEVLITVEGPAVILGVPSGAPTPSILSDTQVSFEVQDFTDIDLMDYFELDMYTSTTATDEDEICLMVQLTSSSADPVSENNYLTFCYPVVNSYDPNNKLVSPMTVNPGFDGWLHYSINFQNTGSAPAFDIRLEDELPTNVDLETFQMTNTSHDSYFELVENDLAVYYPNIMLADSTSNEPDSKGYFQFKIRTTEPLQLGENIENTAAIFFDLNDPVITNTAITSAETTDNINERTNTSNLSLYPNPSNGDVYVKSNEDIIGITCLNLLGQGIDFDYQLIGSQVMLSFKDQKGFILVSIETSQGLAKRKLLLE